MLSEDTVVFLAVHSPVDGMQNAVTPSGPGKVKERSAQEALPGVAECQADGIVHPPRDDHFQLAAVGSGAIDVRGARGEAPAIAQRMALFLKGPLAPVKESVRAEIGAVHVVAAASDGSAVKPDNALVGHVIAIGVAEFPYVGRGSDVDGALVDEDAFREGHAIGENGRMIKDAVAVAIDQPQDTVGGVLELSRRLVRVPGAVGDVEHAVLVETHVNGPLNQGGCGNTLQDEALGNRKRVRG